VATVLVAGGTGALGSAVVAALLEARHRVTATWLVESERDRVAAELGDRAGLELVEADLTDADAAAAAVAAAGDDLAAVVNLVGGYGGGRRAHEIEPDELERMFALNVEPLHLLARAAIPRLIGRDESAFVGVAARAALEPGRGQAAYNAAKAAVLAYVRSLDSDYRDEGLRANAVLPSVIDTPANRAAMPSSDHSRWVAPSAIAEVISFLVSPRSGPISGAAIPVYGRA
jgi:NAD(P)-dependent dehydrogenase (short-subunit alcohol dehydrogenase family)